MNTFKPRSMDEIIKRYGYNWSDLNLDWSILSLVNSDLRKVIFPKDKSFFQKILAKSLMLSRLPECDYSEYDLNNVDFAFGRFSENSTLPKNEDLFSGECRATNIISTSLPKGDYSKYNFEGVSIRGTVFTKDSILPSNKDFFQNIWSKNIEETILPEMDFSEYDFNGVNIKGTEFTASSKIPLNENLFQIVENKDMESTKLPTGEYSKYNYNGVRCGITAFTFESKLPEDYLFFSKVYEIYDKPLMINNIRSLLTENVIRNIHNYNLEGLYVDLKKYSEYLSNEQISILRIKYKEYINKHIHLPEKGLYVENKEIKESLQLNI